MGKKDKSKLTKQVTKSNTPKDNSIESALDYLLKKRTGGSINFKGIGFQVLYASFMVLKYLDKTEVNSVTLEGLEDIDVSIGSERHYIQLKSSQNVIDAGTLWNLKILQHFWEVFSITASSKFQLIHNTNLSKGNLEGLGTSFISEQTISFWKQKFNSIGNTLSVEQLQFFLQRIAIHKTNEVTLVNEVKTLLFEKFGVNIGTELQYLKALFYNIFEWSQKRQRVSYFDLIQLFQSVQDSFSRFPINPAIQNNWITPVSYEIKSESSDYYDGKGARPDDIAKKLPAQRPIWESVVIKNLNQFDAVVIKSSSGQGKSTLAWQVGFAFKENFHIYQLNVCSSYNDAAAVADFLKTRTLIGQSPLVVLDGLNKNLAAWEELAEMVSDQPLKLLITAREEDWIRYGGDNSRISLQVINIGLSIQEAANIYQQLKNNNKLHPTITAWPPAWEKVKDKALLIEYIFILTQGQMIEERLSYQITNLAKEEAGNVKLEIIRLISVADVLNIRIRTSNLTDYIRNNIGQLDQNEIYKQLEKEYYLKFENKYIEGLHPVRSEHLVKILHSHIDIEGSLLALLGIIDEDYIYDYFISAPLLHVLDDEFYKKAATIVSKKTLPEIVFAIDGLMHFEPYRYWQENKKLFDELFQNGGFELFVYDAIPFNKLNTLESLSQGLTDGLGDNIRYLVKQRTKLSKYSIANSALFRFIKYLHSALRDKHFENAEGIAFLFKWFSRVGVNFPNIIEINENDLLKQLEHRSIGESSELFHYYSLISPEKYKGFISRNKETVLGCVKKKTNSLFIYEKEDKIYIEYLLDSDADKANELSVYRINIVHAFFPFCKRYCTSALVLPFPNEEIYKAVLNNAHKEIPPENLFDDFDVHINQIWAKTILGQYAASSSYEWQKGHLQLRENTVELLKNATRLFEARLERDERKANSQIKQVISLITDFTNLDHKLKKYPSNSRKYFDKVPFEEEQKAISLWLSSFRNFVNQFAGIISPKTDQDRHLPWVNLKSAVYHLYKMQVAFEKITEGAHKYFPTDELLYTEKTWHKRGLETVQYYLDQARKHFPANVIVASKSVLVWNETEKQRMLDELHTIIKDFEAESPFIFNLPNKIIEEELLNYAVIGISGCDLRNEQDLWELSVGLKELATTGIHFFTFLFVDNDKKVTGALRFNQHYFEIFKKLLDTGEHDENESSLPLPVFPDEAMLNVLDGISLHTAPNNSEFDAYFKMLMAAWKLSEYRRGLNPNISVEKNWLEEIEDENRDLITQSFPIIYDGWMPDIKPDRKTMEQFLNKELDLEKDELVRHLAAVSLAISSVNKEE